MALIYVLRSRGPTTAAIGKRPVDTLSARTQADAQATYGDALTCRLLVRVIKRFSVSICYLRFLLASYVQPALTKNCRFYTRDA